LHGVCAVRRHGGRAGRDPQRGLWDLPRSRAVLAMKRPIRVVVAKAGLDGHDRGAKVVARALRDAGMEVIYTGVHQTPEQVVETALQEDVDAIGVSLLSGAHRHLFPRIAELMKERGLNDVLLFGGGIIPESDEPFLEEHGVDKVFRPGAPLDDIIGY